MGGNGYKAGESAPSLFLFAKMRYYGDMLKGGKKTRKKVSLYSLADWKYHHNQLGYDDLVDGGGRLVVTVNVLDIAVDEMLSREYIAAGFPKKMFILESDNRWMIYLNAKWLTPKIIQQALDEFGKMVGRRFRFEPNRLPPNLDKRYRKVSERMRQEVEHARTHSGLKSAAGLLKTFKKNEIRRKIQSKEKLAVASKRLVEIIAHKLKF